MGNRVTAPSRRVAAPARARRLGPRVRPRPALGARPALHPRQQIGQYVLRVSLVGLGGPADVAGPHRAVEGDQAGHAVAPEVTGPQVPAVARLALFTRFCVITRAALFAGSALFARWWARLGRT
jgi:hypothetical protein